MPGRRGLLRLGAALAARPALAEPPRQLAVGPGRRFRTLAAALAAARAGDELLIEAGFYPDDGGEIRRPVSLRAVGGLARLVAGRPPANGKAILVVAADARIEGLALSGATSADRNGAGLRYEGGRLELHRCRLADNEMNLLAAPDPAGRIAITACAFGPTRPTEGLSHALYVNEVAELQLDDCLFEGVASGHLVKSRARRSRLLGCRLQEAGGAAYAVDLPDGGAALIAGCRIEQGPGSAHPAMVNYGGEAPPHPGSRLELRDNLVVNRFPGEAARLLRNRTALRAELAGNRIFGLAPRQVADGPARVRDTVWLASPPPDPAPPWPAPE